MKPKFVGEEREEGREDERGKRRTSLHGELAVAFHRRVLCPGRHGGMEIMMLAYLQDPTGTAKPASPPQAASSLFLCLFGQRTAEGRRSHSGHSSRCWGSGSPMLQGESMLWESGSESGSWHSGEVRITACLIESISPREAAASALGEPSPAGLLSAWLSSVPLQGHVCLGVCERITRLFVCFHLPYKQFGLLPGKRNDVSRAHTHTRSQKYSAWVTRKPTLVLG